MSLHHTQANKAKQIKSFGIPQAFIAWPDWGGFSRVVKLSSSIRESHTLKSCSQHPLLTAGFKHAQSKRHIQMSEPSQGNIPCGILTFNYLFLQPLHIPWHCPGSMWLGSCRRVLLDSMDGISQTPAVSKSRQGNAPSPSCLHASCLQCQAAFKHQLPDRVSY